MNVFNEHPFKVMFDYGHNAHAVGVMADLAQRLDVTGRRIVRAGRPGRPPRRGHARDRRGGRRQASTTTSAGATTACAAATATRCRASSPRALQARGVPEDAISMIPDEQEAIDAALRMGQPGDLVLVFADALTRSWKQIIQLPAGGRRAAGRAARRGARRWRPTLDEQLVAAMEGVVRDERGLRFEREESD